ncbi:MAG: hypothetical protein IT373_32990 [Polyangiaceae bacterium]|nr:hypothetical protein [Polyangiaceae bacterium]
MRERRGERGSGLTGANTARARAARTRARLGVATLALCAAGAGLAQMLGAGCSANAVDIEGCRAIEQARCEAILGCPGSSIEDEDDVEACKLFYRDQCLFGMATDAPPDEIALDACLTAIAKAGACKATELASCSDPPAILNTTPAGTTGCGIVAAPEWLADCAFLSPTPLSDGGVAEGGGGAGAGGTGGAGGSSGGTGGTGGAGGTGTTGGAGGTGGTGG